MDFPFTALFESKPYYERVRSILTNVTQSDAPSTLLGHPPFSAAKRYLRLISPPLWEEAEHIEAEVRMASALFLAAVYALVVSAVAAVIGVAAVGVAAVVGTRHGIEGAQWLVVSSWLFGSAIVVLILGIGFNARRVYEVEYTYLNLILAEGYRLQTQKSSASENSSREQA
jgi:hypothetical protein